MKDLLTLALAIALLTAFAGLGGAQQKGQERSRPKRVETEEVVIEGGKATLKRGFSFGRIVKDQIQVLDGAGRYVIGLSCMCDAGDGGGCRIVDSGGGYMNCINDACTKGRCGAALVSPPPSSEMNSNILSVSNNRAPECGRDLDLSWAGDRGK